MTETKDNERIARFFLLAFLAIVPMSWADHHEEEDLQAVALGALGGANVSAATTAAFAVDPLTGVAAEVVAFSTGLALKNLPAALIEPDDIDLDPDSADQCTLRLRLPQSEFAYTNIYGLDIDAVPGDWGVLGTPELYHWDTSVNLSVRSPLIAADEQARTYQIPAGRHSFQWHADTQLNLVADLAIPAALLYTGVTSKLKVPGTLPAAASGNASAARAGLKKFQNALVFLAKDLQLLPKTVFYAGSRYETTANVIDFLTIDTAGKQHEQVLTVYDLRPPVIRYGDAAQPANVQLPTITLEAMDFGGILRARIPAVLPTPVTAEDPCDRYASLANDIPDLLPIGTNRVTWTARDLGPVEGGGVNTVLAFQDIIVRDTQGPIMVTPPGRVIEIDPGEDGVDSASVALGMPRVVDLADPSPQVFNDVPAIFPIGSRTPVTWRTRDASGNETTGEQLITVKEAGTNTAPAVGDVQVQTLTSQPVDIVLRGVDNDVLDGVADPLSIRLQSRPTGGEFVAPLLPFFIEDFRTTPEGPYGPEFYTASSRSGWLNENVCGPPSNSEIRVDWVYQPRFIHVLDSGDYYLLDDYWECSGHGPETSKRISKWSRDNAYQGQIDYVSLSDTFVMDDDGYLYVPSRTGESLSLAQFRADLENDLSASESGGDRWRVDRTSRVNAARGLDDSNIPFNGRQLSYARVDSDNGLLFVTERTRVYVFDVRGDLADPEPQSYVPAEMGAKYLGVMNGGQPFLCNAGNHTSSWTGFAMEVDSEGNLYVTDTCDDQVHKFSPSYFEDNGTFVMGSYVGWLGGCESSTNNACDTENERSRGFSCTDTTCTVATGSGPGQFDAPLFVDLDGNDVLYVADRGRVQRFAPDGTFGGEARSTGTGINQGDRPGFVLGNLGTVQSVTVNSTHFFVVDEAESFVHVFETTPLKDITDGSATVTYVSNFNFHSSVDTFTYSASDGLDDSNVATVSVQVDRNYRQPEAHAQSLVTDERVPVDVTLTGDDPDGVIGTDDVFPLDTLTFRVVERPRGGTLSGTPPNLRYTPNTGFHGSDRFLFVANDGREDSEPAAVDITVNYIDDPQEFVDVAWPERVGVGFPVAFRAEFEDDGHGGGGYNFWMEWTRNVEYDFEGDFEDPDGPDGPEAAVLNGVKIIEPVDGVGRGSLLADHTYSTLGSREARVCLVTFSAGRVCDETTILVESLVSLGIDATNGPLETMGSAFEIDLSVRNLVPSAGPALSATGVNLEQSRVDDIRVAQIVSGSGDCAISSGLLRCSADVLAPDEAVTATIRIERSDDTPLIYDLGVPFAMTVRTSSQALLDKYTLTRWLTFQADPTDTDGDGMTDAFERAYGLDLQSPADASVDSDGDQLSNLEEFEARTNPLVADTDGDGARDDEDFCPVDAGGSLEGLEGICEQDIRSNAVLRTLQIMNQE